MSATPEPTAAEPQHTEPTETPLEAIASLLTVVVVGMFIMAFCAQTYVIPSPSMTQTLLVGDHVVVDRGTFAPPTKWAPFVRYRDVRRGDVIVFYKPNPESPDLILVKRCIGIPGDHIHLQHGVVYVNGVAQKEPYARMPDDSLTDSQDGYSPYRDDFPAIAPDLGQELTATWRVELPEHIEDGDLIVPAGKLFAMGDNRTESLDSRYWGFVPRENILGRPMFVYWSFETPADEENKTSVSDRASYFLHVIVHFFGQTRWMRTFHVIR